MKLKTKVRNICREYAALGWDDVFKQFGIDITIDSPTALVEELVKERTFSNIAGNMAGFEDLSPMAKRGIEAGEPSESLLFHAFASPNVTRGKNGRVLRGFPTLAQLETLENFVYAVKPPTMQDLERRAAELGNRFRSEGKPSLAIVVFASQYRTRPNTVHKLHADMVYSQTGVSRVGTEKALYDRPRRGFWPEGSKPKEIRATASQWAPYIAVLLTANHDIETGSNRFGPMRPQRRDFGSRYWVPIHKLFDGDECIVGRELEIMLDSEHVNSKLQRIHRYFGERNIDGGLGGIGTSKSPFVFREGIAEISKDSELGPGVMTPVPHRRLVETAVDKNGKPIDFKVPQPRPGIRLFASSLELRSTSPGRPVPEYVHIRHTPLEDGGIDNLNDDPQMRSRLFEPGRRAIHYLDFTGDGWVQANVKSGGRKWKLPAFPGYSIVTAPDFYPGCDQRQLLDWHDGLNPQDKAFAQWSTPPSVLSDIPFPPDPLLSPEGGKPVFDNDVQPALNNITAIVASVKSSRNAAGGTSSTEVSRHGGLPDSAAGIFAPGWDISSNQTDGELHLASYGLGSPFPEDAKLCAALSAFWPAAAPDSTRAYLRPGDSIAPMTDEEISGVHPWDGIQGTSLDVANQQVEFPDFFFADYIDSALAGTITLSVTNKVDAEEYQRRVLTTGRVRSFLGQRQSMIVDTLHLVSFQAIDESHVSVSEARSDSGTQLMGPIYLFRLANVDVPGANRMAGDHRRFVAGYDTLIEVLADETHILMKDNGAWTP